MSDLIERITNLSPAKRALLQRSLLEKPADAPRSPVLSRRLSQGPASLSFAQLRLWFLDQMEPQNPAYNIPLRVRLQGQLDSSALEHSLQAIVQRHEVLRTTFSSVDGQPVQVIAPRLALLMPFIDLQTLSPEQQDAEVLRLTTAEAHRPFDLASGPLLRANVLQLSEQTSVFLLSLHHIVVDGWSLAIIMRELSLFYTAFRTQQPVVIPDLPLQYADYAAWQRQWLQGDVLDELLTWWKQQPGAHQTLLALPGGQRRPAVQTFHGATLEMTIPAALATALNVLSQREGVTLFMTLLAAFQTLLYRYSGQADITIGSPVAGRTHSELQDLVGCFVNIVMFHTTLTGTLPFRQVLARVRESTLEAYAHQDLPFEKLIEGLHPHRDLSHTPFHQVMFSLQNIPLENWEFSGLHVTLEEGHTDTAKFDMTLGISQVQDGLHCWVQYSTDLFDAATIERMLGHFQTLLTGIIANQDCPLADLPLLPEHERAQMLVAWNTTRAEYPRDVCLHRLFEEQVDRVPERIALVYEEHQLTYDRLNRCANQLADHLQQRGVGPEVLVGLCMERSLEMAVGLLAILKARGAYLPLDPGYPRERLEFMLRDSQAWVLLTRSDVLARLPQQEGVATICIDPGWETGMPGQAHNPVGRVHPDQLVYMIYTSGSTGTPKGVMISQQGIVNHMQWMQKTFPLQETDRVLQRTSVSFDGSVWEFFAPLQVGGSLVLLPAEGQRDSALIIRVIKEQQITTLRLVPGLLGMLLQEPELAACQSLQRVFCGGEALTADRVNALFDLIPVPLYNLYGPTEATILATYTITRPGGAHTVIPIGRPMANTRLYILDVWGQPVPIGVTGELFIGGVGLARGYFQRPALTAQRFIPDPLSDEPGARLYRTGDRVRYLADGNIEFLGRSDHQVKIRGFRIEPGEIEGTLAQHHSVQEVAVIAREGHAGDQQLVAYVVNREQRASGSELRSYLQSKLPEYMIPTHFVLLEKLPRTPNGKLDRSALPAPEDMTSATASPLPVAHLPTNELLLGIWQEVLHVKQVESERNFFEAGGHSLLATQILARTRKTFGIELPLRTLFEAPTLAEFARRVEAARSMQQHIHPPSIQAGRREGRIPLSYGQQRLWFLDRLEPGNALHHVPLILRLHGQLHVAALEFSINTIIQRHEALRTTFPHAHGLPAQCIAPSQLAPMTLIDLRALPVTEREQKALGLARKEALHPFDLQRGPVLRSSLLRLSEQEHLFLLTMHHIVTDGWSLGVLFQELSALYTAHIQHRPARLPALPVQYPDYASWQRQWMSGAVLETHQAYWQQRLAGLPTTLNLPFARPRPAARTFQGAGLPFTCSGELTGELITFSRREGVTLFMTLLAAYATVLYRSTGQGDIVIGTDTANRSRLELEGLIGFFTNQVVLRTAVSGDLTVRELLGHVREVTLGAYAHQEMPFDRVVEIMKLPRERGRAPLFHVKIVFQRAAAQALSFPGLTVQPIELQNPHTTLDLTLFITETEQGLTGVLHYNADVFEATTISRMLGEFQALLVSMVAQPETRLSELAMVTEAERKQHTMEQRKHQATARARFNAVKPQAISISARDSITTSYLSPAATLPLVIQPALADVDLAGWAQGNQAFIEATLREHGAILFRGFAVESVSEFERFALTLCPTLFKENSEHTPVTAGGNVQTPVFYPAANKLLWHNENSFNYRWPLKIWFGCMQPAAQGGETPLVDSRKVFARLDRAITDRFMSRGVMYVRNYGDGLGLDWQTVFRTTSTSVVESLCREEFIQFEWKGGNRLRTCSVRPAVIHHPGSGEISWFNQAQHWHISCLDPLTRASLLELFRPEDLPRTCSYGDGTPIEDSVMEEILGVYSELEVCFPWQRGDVALLDNVLTAHGRNPYVGDRKQLVALGEMMHFEIKAQ